MVKLAGERARVLAELTARTEPSKALLSGSFLPDEMKASYAQLLDARSRLLA